MSTEENSTVNWAGATAIRNHPIYYFDDGSLILDVEKQRFKVHRTLLSRHSRFFSSISISPIHNGINASNNLNHNVQHIHLEPKRQVRGEDVEALLQHLYHDVLLGKESPFAHIASILRASSPQQLDFPHLHTTARETLESMFSNNPGAFVLNHPLHDALAVANEFNLKFARKAILYSLVTTTDFELSDSTPSSLDPHMIQPTSPETRLHDSISLDHNSESITPAVGETEVMHEAFGTPPVVIVTPEPNRDSASAILLPTDAAICMRLMTNFIDHFTPILFTPPATRHMACTDVFADMWMSSVIQPALADDGVYKPLETLERIKNIDWGKHGLCESCIVEKREEWIEEQATVWRLMDTWLKSEMTRPKN